MPMTTCRECGKELSTRSLTCPHCGVILQGRGFGVARRILQGVAIFIAGLLALFLVLAITAGGK